MTPDPDHDFYRVVSISGQTFYTRAKTATQFVLDPTFIQFMTLSVFLFTSLMFATGLPVVAQVVLFGGGIVSTFFWLTITINIYLTVIKRLGFITFYTPLLLLPVLTANTFGLDYALRAFGTSYLGGFDGIWEISIRTLIVVVCLDIFHGKFVACQHGWTVVFDQDGNPIPPDVANPPLEPPLPANAVPTPQVGSSAPVSGPVPAPLGDGRPNGALAEGAATPGVVQTTQPPKPSCDLSIGRECFDLAEILYIKSEDHYLVVQFAKQSEMIRARLREVAATIEPVWGLQINRSVWVAYRAISAVQESAKGQLSVQLKDGTCYKVANSRKILFEHGCTQYAPDITWEPETDPDL